MRKSAKKGFNFVAIRDSVSSVVDHPAFAGFGHFLFPTENNSYEGIQLENIQPLLPFHNFIDQDSTVNSINRLIEEVDNDKNIFYDFYSEKEIKEDKAKTETGLFYFRGKPGKPFAVICPGGGFSYVGSIHEGFPYALELNKKGYNAFVLKYRVGGEKIACEDLAAALAFIFKNSKMLEVCEDNYSLWGSSAGARMVARIGSEGTVSYGEAQLPKPAAIIMAYTAHPDFSKEDPPTFVVSSEDDQIVNINTVEKRVKALVDSGIDVEYRKYKNSSHGFGLGIGSDAFGWFDHAIKFWEKHIKG